LQNIFKTFFVNLITSIFHHLLFLIYLCNIRNIFNITKFIFKKLFKIIGVRLLTHSRFYYYWLQPIILNVRYDNFFKLPNLFCCGGWTRTTDLQVMSLPSYHCSTPRYYVEMTRLELVSYKELIIPAYHTFSKFYQNLQIRRVLIIHRHHYSNSILSSVSFHSISHSI